MAENRLYFGDNLDILRRYIGDDSVDLIYLDPPFNSKADYNVLYREKSGLAPFAQIKAFEDTWHWSDVAEATYNELVTRGTSRVSETIQALRKLAGMSDMSAYLVMMAIRLIELRRVLKPTGTIYLHCDPTASHYLKTLMDAIFGPEQFLNEVIWKRTGTHSSANRWGPIHDVLLFYAKQRAKQTWNRPYVPMSEEHMRHHYNLKDERGRTYTHGELTGPGVRHGSSGTAWRGFDVTSIGRHWITTIERLEQYDADEKIYWPQEGGWPRLIRYEDESKGQAVGDVWNDIPPINMKAKERLGYPTQKPLALLERIISASSNPDDVVLDPFCGCGTAVIAAQKLGRRWIGIDITHLSVALMKYRLRDTFGEKVGFAVHGEPADTESARALAAEDRYQFQYWALSLVGARPAASEEKKGADRGLDGVIYLLEGKGQARPVVIQVKSGHVTRSQIGDFGNVIARERAAIGLFITLDAPTKEMTREAGRLGFYRFPLTGKEYPKCQIRTVEQLLLGRGFDLPPRPIQFAQAERHVPRPENAVLELFDQPMVAEDSAPYAGDARTGNSLKSE